VTGRYRVDLDHLADLVDQMARFDQHLESMLDDADARVNRLHAAWEGEAAEQHRRAHDEWKHGAQQMRDALAVMRKIAMTAHSNYSNATATNAAMWRQAL
jgi:WXG100 family type VII secretion target